MGQYVALRCHENLQQQRGQRHRQAHHRLAIASDKFLYEGRRFCTASLERVCWRVFQVEANWVRR